VSGFSKLLFLEIERAKRWFFTLLVLVFSLQVAYFAVHLFNWYRESRMNNQITAEVIIPAHPIVILAIMIGFVALAFYCFWTWLREWSNKGTFIYRLLLLPQNRMCIYWAKLVSIIILLLVLVATEILLLTGYYYVFEAVTPVTYKNALVPLSMVWTDVSVLPFAIIPVFWGNFIMMYGAGLGLIMTIFSLVLIERSYKAYPLLTRFGLPVLWGMLLTVAAVSITYVNRDNLLVWLNLMSVGLCVLNALLSLYLIQKRISV